MSPRLAGLLALAIPLCIAAPDSPPPPADGGGRLRVVCDGIVTASLAGQDLMYAGRSEFAWAGLQVRVNGQLHVFCGASLRRTPGGTRASGEIQSITANGEITVLAREGAGSSELRGKRLVIRPHGSAADAASVTLDGRTNPDGSPLPGALVWQAGQRRWLPRR